MRWYDDEYEDDSYNSFTDDVDWARETWYALTDGMYGDYPGDYDDEFDPDSIDYDVYGF